MGLSAAALWQPAHMSKAVLVARGTKDVLTPPNHPTRKFLFALCFNSDNMVTAQSGGPLVVNHRGKSGFSLVELSIVLVILGLLVGGVLSGQSLIRAAELRAVTRDFSTFMAATYTFRDKYFAIPGDMPNATQFWGSMNGGSACLSSVNASATLTTGVCDGDGDGKILSNSWSGTNYRPTESWQYWRQLGKAGLIAGNYSGTWGTSGSNVAGVMIPQSPLGNEALYQINYFTTASAPYYNLDYENNIALYGVGGNALTPQEAWNIDTKIDDGKPAYGRIIAVGAIDTCASATTPPSTATNYVADYRLSDSTKQCSLILRNL